MKRVRLSEIAKKPRYLAEFPLLGKTISPIAQFLPTDDGKFKIGNPGAIPPFGKLVETGKEYALVSDDGDVVEIRIVSREANSAIAEPLSIEDADLLAEIKVVAISEVTIVKVRNLEVLSVPERLEHERVISKTKALRNDPDYSFTSKLVQAALNSEDAIARIEAAKDDDAKLEIQNEIILATLEARSPEENARSSRDEELSIEMLDLSRKQLEILGSLKPGALAEMSMPAIQSILAVINSPDEEVSEDEDEDEPEEKPKAKRRSTAKKESAPSVS